MAKSTVKRPTRIKIGGVEVILQSHPLKGTLSEAKIARAIAKVRSKTQESKRKGRGGEKQKAPQR